MSDSSCSNMSHSSGNVSNINLKKGSVLFESNPFIHVLMDGKRETHCWNCVQKRGNTVTCTHCTAMYCSEDCRVDDGDHDLECDLMEVLSEYSEQTRFMVKLMLKLHRKNGWNIGEPASVLDRPRKFKHLMSHSDKLSESDKGLRNLYNILVYLIPEAAGTWQYYKEVYGRLVINSFELNDEKDDKVGWGLFLAPSILNHSCVPNAEAEFVGKKLLIRVNVNVESAQLSDIYISYIGLTDSTEKRKAKLSKYYHFQCLCLRCQGLKLSWVAAENFNPRYQSLIGQKPSVVEAIQEAAKGKERDYLWSLRCPYCSGRPIKCAKDQTEATCRHCRKSVDKDFISDYHEIISVVDKMLKADSIPMDGPQQCVELMTGIVYPYSIIYIKCLELAVDDCILKNNLKLAVEFALSLLTICRRFTKQSAASVSLIIRIYKLFEELGKYDRALEFLEQAQVEAYADTKMLNQVLELKTDFMKRCRA